MHRRRVLATLATTASGSLAGCSTASSGGTQTRTPTDCPTVDSRWIGLVGTESIPDAAELSIVATVERAQFSASEPATLAVTISNEGDGRALDVTDGPRCHAFEREQGRSDPYGLWLYRAADAPEDRAGACWTRVEAAPDSVGFDGYSCGRYSLAAGDSVTTTYEVWDDYAIGDYFEAGTYRFETTVSVYADEDADDPVRSADWWLDLVVRNTATTERPQEFTSSR